MMMMITMIMMVSTGRLLQHAVSGGALASPPGGLLALETEETEEEADETMLSIRNGLRNVIFNFQLSNQE